MIKSYSLEESWSGLVNRPPKVSDTSEANTTTNLSIIKILLIEFSGE